MPRQIVTLGSLGLVAAALLLVAPMPALAQKERVLQARGDGPMLAAMPERRRPGAPRRDAEPLPAIDPTKVPPPSPMLPRESIPVPDRWRLIEAIGVNEKWWDPYNQNTLKADRPLFDEWFLNIALISDTIYEPRRIPTPTGVQSSDRVNTLDIFGDTNQSLFNENLIVSLSFLRGDTAYRPPDYEFRVTPVFNYNRSEVEERRVLFADPGKGTKRHDRDIGIQEAFFDYHIRNVSDRFDFDSVRAGIQPIQVDFRGFVFQDQQLGLRFFGNRNNNVFQYNLAYFRRLEKDVNSGLNDIRKELREDDVFIANLYYQDFPVLGFVSQGVIIHNRNKEDSDFFFNKNGFLERPASFGDERGRSYRVTYLGLNGDGHFGRLNLTGSLYYLTGTDDHNQFSGVKSEVEAHFAAFEASVDFSWIRWRASFLLASGDDDAFDDKEKGFDAIFENPQFAGADTSFWIRQGIPLIGGGGVALAQRNAVLPSLRSSKEHGQSVLFELQQPRHRPARHRRRRRSDAGNSPVHRPARHRRRRRSDAGNSPVGQYQPAPVPRNGIARVPTQSGRHRHRDRSGHLAGADLAAVVQSEHHLSLVGRDSSGRRRFPAIVCDRPQRG